MWWRRLFVGFWMLALPSGEWFAECPPAADVRARLDRIDFTDTARVARFGGSTPSELQAEALAEPGEVAVAQDGKAGHAVALVPLPVESLWKAINDEDHQAGFLVDESVVVAGTPRGTRRVLLQSVERLGVGRYWIDRMEMSGELFERSGGKLWELTWEDAFDAVDSKHPAVRRAAARHRPVEWTRGAWLFVPMGSRCTWIDYSMESDPGGALSAFQALGAKKALRDAVEGLVRMAREHMAEPHPKARFVRPDGEVLP